MFLGSGCTKLIKDSSSQDEDVIKQFRATALTAYQSGGVAMQSKMPLNNPCVDPIVRGESVAVRGLRLLGSKYMAHILNDEEKLVVDKEILTFAVDSKLPIYIYLPGGGRCCWLVGQSIPVLQVPPVCP